MATQPAFIAQRHKKSAWINNSCLCYKVDDCSLLPVYIISMLNTTCVYLYISLLPAFTTFFACVY